MTKVSAFRLLCTLVVMQAMALAAATAADKAPLAIKGYDPVAYFTLGRAVPGLPELEVEWDEQRYRFSRPEHLRQFKEDPARYAPRFANLCTIALTRGELVEANPEYWVISEGRLYLFGKAIGPKLFQQDAAGNVAKAERSFPRANGR